MKAEELKEATVNDLIKKINNNIGLNQFAIERSKFEGWLKVELIDSLMKNQIIAKPEVSRVDVSFENTAIELKTINTNYRFDNVKNKTRPITKNIDGILKDITDLKKNEVENRFVVFIVFPVDFSKPEWLFHLKKVEDKLLELTFKEFEFNNGIPAIIYYGKI